MTSRIFLCLLGICGLFYQPATYAWNSAGHRISAGIAWTQLNAAAKHEASVLLRAHESDAEWTRKLSRGKNPLPPEAIDFFAEASTWADDIKRDERYRDNAGNDSVRPANRHWHYVNWPVNGGRINSRSGQLDFALNTNAIRLADCQASNTDRSVALVWLIHLTADAHQPLHVATWLLDNGQRDDGGLAFLIVDTSRPPAKRQLNLHTWWDDLPGTNSLRGAPLNVQVNYLLTQFPVANIQQKSPNEWLNESLSIARTKVRPNAAVSESAWPINEDYRALAKKISERRLLESGVRLGRWLNDLLHCPKQASGG